MISYLIGTNHTLYTVPNAERLSTRSGDKSLVVSFIKCAGSSLGIVFVRLCWLSRHLPLLAPLAISDDLNA
jgi:hypothetical protein